MALDPQSELASEMNAGETLLWAGHPKRGFLLRPVDLFLIPFSLFWCGFAVFWMIGASGMLWAGSQRATPGPINFIFALFGLPFVLVGLYMVFGRFLVDRAQRDRTVYAVSNERILIRSGLFSRTVKSLNLRTLSDITLSERSDGSGTVTFGASLPMFAAMQGMNWWPGTHQYQAPPSRRRKGFITSSAKCRNRMANEPSHRIARHSEVNDLLARKICKDLDSPKPTKI